MRIHRKRLPVHETITEILSHGYLTTLLPSWLRGLHLQIPKTSHSMKRVMMSNGSMAHRCQLLKPDGRLLMPVTNYRKHIILLRGSMTATNVKLWRTKWCLRQTNNGKISWLHGCGKWRVVRMFEPTKPVYKPCCSALKRVKKLTDLPLFVGMKKPPSKRSIGILQGSWWYYCTKPVTSTSQTKGEALKLHPWKCVDLVWSGPFQQVTLRRLQTSLAPDKCLTTLRNKSKEAIGEAQPESWRADTHLDKKKIRHRKIPKLQPKHLQVTLLIPSKWRRTN